MGLAPRPTAADSVMPTDWSARPSSSMARHRAVKPASLPPQRSGKTRPNSPRSAMAATRSSGKVASRSQRSAWGATSRVAKSRTTARNASCSSDRSKCTAPRYRPVPAGSADEQQADGVGEEEQDDQLGGRQQADDLPEPPFVGFDV